MPARKTPPISPAAAACVADPHDASIPPGAEHTTPASFFAAQGMAERTPAGLPGPCLDTREAAAFLHLNEKKLYELAKNGQLPAARVGGKWLFPRALLEEWLLEQAHGGALSDRLLITGSDDPLLERVLRGLAHDLDGRALVTDPTGAAFDPDSPARWLATPHGIDITGLSRAALVALERQEPLLVLSTAFALVALLDELGGKKLADRIEVRGAKMQRTEGKETGRRHRLVVRPERIDDVFEQAEHNDTKGSDGTDRVAARERTRTSQCPWDQIDREDRESLNPSRRCRAGGPRSGVNFGEANEPRRGTSSGGRRQPPGRI